ncbi:MAG: hypothetical protein HPY68_07965, partial [Candidatus Atribacteria bacterium]|nr:hypothetical protein [Candidatus Atribacteria bacterium]
MSPLWWGILGSLVAGAATGIGGIPVLFPSLHRISHRFHDELLGFAAGVMLAGSAERRAPLELIRRRARRVLIPLWSLGAVVSLSGL